MLDYIAIGRRIKFYRKERNITQNKLAEMLNVTDKYLSAIETGRGKVSLSRLHDISVALSVDISCFLKDTDDEQPSYCDHEILEATKNLNSQQKNILLNIIHALSQSF